MERGGKEGNCFACTHETNTQTSASLPNHQPTYHPPTPADTVGRPRIVLPAFLSAAHRAGWRPPRLLLMRRSRMSATTRRSLPSLSPWTTTRWARSPPASPLLQQHTRVVDTHAANNPDNTRLTRQPPFLLSPLCVCAARDRVSVRPRLANGAAVPPHTVLFRLIPLSHWCRLSPFHLYTFVQEIKLCKLLCLHLPLAGPATHCSSPFPPAGPSLAPPPASVRHPAAARCYANYEDHPKHPERGAFFCVGVCVCVRVRACVCVLTGCGGVWVRGVSGTCHRRGVLGVSSLFRAATQHISQLHVCLLRAFYTNKARQLEAGTDSPLLAVLEVFTWPEVFVFGVLVF